MAYLSAFGVLALLTILPGPDLAIVSRFTLSEGRGAGLRATLGVIAGLAVWGAMTLLGIAAALAASAEIFDALRVIGALYLVLIGVRLLRRAPSAMAPTSTRSGAFRAGFLTNLLNPKIAIFYTTVLLSLVPHGAPATSWLLLLIATHVALSLAWLVACGSLLAASGRLARPGLRRRIDTVTGVILIALGIRTGVLSA